MSYMQNNLAFAGGIHELSLNEIGFVSGGFGDELNEGFFEAQEFGDDWETGKKKKKKDEATPPTPEIPDGVIKKVAKKLPYIGAALTVYDIVTDVIDIFSN